MPDQAAVAAGPRWVVVGDQLGPVAEEEREASETIGKSVQVRVCEVGEEDAFRA